MSKLLIVHGILLLIGIFISGPLCHCKCSGHKAKCSLSKTVGKKITSVNKFLTELELTTFVPDDFIFEHETITLGFLFENQFQDILLPGFESIRAPPKVLS